MIAHLLLVALWVGLVLIASAALGGIWLAVQYVIDGLLEPMRRIETPCAAGPATSRKRVA